MHRAEGATGAVHERDLRFTYYSDPTRSFMGAELTFDDEGQLIEAHRTRDMSFDASTELAALAECF